ncbi:hypothetical protein OG785_05820 [Streptomyces sp. NBC_00006]|uniref:hypothetical protein n=1 Tax=Streptomyces sp. NBC_00006 TaxID=2975619 RepID=UPI00224FAD94|nr:hypothetical protein [Streptomyces sp. NBC_00006]MCX5530073.1 hypothetical protein [Streptomyces sp. NBC_00006]
MKNARAITAAFLASATMAAATLFAAAPTATAADACAGKSYKHVVKRYNNGLGIIPLRCGTSTWGYRHLVARGRWSASFDKKITKALWSGTPVTITGGRWHYYMVAVPPCTKYFGVLDNPNTYGRDHVTHPQGIITAYSMGEKPGGALAPNVSSETPAGPAC